MISARAELTIAGPGLVARVHGDGDVLVVDLFADVRKLVAVLRSASTLARHVRSISGAFRKAGLGLDIRVSGRTIARLGKRRSG